MPLRPTLLLPVLMGALLAAPSLAAADAVNQASPGQPLDVKSVLRPGRTNIVDFYSKYCPPCMRISPLLEELGKKRSDLNVVKVDINRPEVTGIDWKSPLAAQYGLHSIPHFKIFDGNGNLVQEGQGAYQQVIVWLKAEKIIN